MALVVQNDTGTAAAANGYITLAEFKAYHDARGNAYSADDAVNSQSIVRATDYMDQRFNWRGVKLNGTDQTTGLPRCAIVGTEPVLLKDPDGNDIEGIITPAKNACAEYALRAQAATLFVDAPAPDGGVAIDSITQKVDVIEQSIKYRGNSGEAVIPGYPAADLWLARSGLITVGRNLYR